MEKKFVKEINGQNWFVNFCLQKILSKAKWEPKCNVFCTKFQEGICLEG
jgi:hypothetical protein